MRHIFSLLPLLFLVSCSRTTAGINIGAQQKFVLGEYMTKEYKARLNNQGPQDITVNLVNKSTEKIVGAYTLAPGRRTTLSVAPANRVEIVNPNDREGLVKARLNRGNVPGMEYRGIGEKAENKNYTSWRIPTKPAPNAVIKKGFLTVPR